MLTFRRAVYVAAVVLTCLYFFSSIHHGDNRITNADDLPKPEPVGSTTLHKEKAEEQTTKKQPAPMSTQVEPIVQVKKKPPTQVSLSDLRHQPLRQQLAYQFPYDVEAKFPAYVWQTWKTTPASGKFEEEYREGEASWTILHPTFVHEVITDDMAVKLLTHLYASIPQVLEAYHALPMPVLKADFFRYLILLARGGIYTDIDTSALKPATDWVPADVPRNSYGMVIGIEADPDREDWQSTLR